MTTYEDLPTQARLIDHLAPILDEIQRLEAHQQQLRADLAAICAHPGVGEDEIAEVYWLEESVPAKLLGRPHEVLKIAGRHPHWSWRCSTCGAEVFVTSRSDKHQRESPSSRTYTPSYWQCAECRKADQVASTAVREEASQTYAARDAELRTMPYRKYLQTEEWQERRRAALKRAGYTCQVCNRSRQLHVHHRTYERRGAELARDLIVLCDECHALYHGKGLLADQGQET